MQQLTLESEMRQKLIHPAIRTRRYGLVRFIPFAFRVLIGVVTGCDGAKGIDTSDGVTGCSSWTGLVATSGSRSTWFTFGSLRPPHEEVVLDAVATLDSDTNELRVEFELSSDSAYESNEFDIQYSASGVVVGACDALGLSVYQRDIAWNIQDPFGRYDVTASTTTYWAPPRMLLSGDPEVGDRWVNNLLQTTIHSSGKTSETTINEEVQVVEMQTLDRTILGSQSALVVQGEDGHRSYYVEGSGLMLGDALVRYVASCCEYD